MTDYSTKHRTELESYLNSHELSSGIGNTDKACTIAAINLVLSGKLTDDIPACMSRVLGEAVIKIQDVMPEVMRNSVRYKTLIPGMPGTARTLEKERLTVLMDWLWETVLPQVQPMANNYGFGAEWQKMCQEKTKAAAYAASRAARRSAAMDAADAASSAASDYAAYIASARAAYAASCVTCTTVAVARAAAADYADFWDKVDPIGVLERMTYLNGGKK